jgi:hypothetical protein
VQGHCRDGIEVLTFPVGTRMPLERLKNELGVKTALVEGCQDKLNIPAVETWLGCSRDFGREYFQPL